MHHTSEVYPKTFSIGHADGPVDDTRIAATDLLELRPSTPGLPPQPRPEMTTASTTGTRLTTTEEPRSTTCKHVNQTKKGSNAYVDMVTCKDCGQLLKKEKKDRDASITLDPPTQARCEHNEISWHGTNGYSWKWTCRGCGATGSEKKIQGKPKPIPFGKAGPLTKASLPSPPSSSSPSPGRYNISDEDFVTSVDE